MGTYKLNLGDANNYLKWDGFNLYVRGNIVIEGGSGIANLTDAGDLALYNQVSAALLDSTIIVGGYIKTSLLTADNIRTGTLRSVRVRIGGGTNEDIYFEDSGVRMYDAGGRAINIYKYGYKNLQLALGPTAGVLSSNGKLQLSGSGNIEMWASSKVFYFYTTGKMRFPTLSSAPSGGASGDVAVCNLGILHDYYSGTWVRLTGEAGW